MWWCDMIASSGVEGLITLRAGDGYIHPGRNASLPGRKDSSLPPSQGESLGWHIKDRSPTGSGQSALGPEGWTYPLGIYYTSGSPPQALSLTSAEDRDPGKFSVLKESCKLSHTTGSSASPLEQGLTQGVRKFLLYHLLKHPVSGSLCIGDKTRNKVLWICSISSLVEFLGNSNWGL